MQARTHPGKMRTSPRCAGAECTSPRTRECVRGVREPLQWRGVWRTAAPGGKAGNSHGAESAQHGKHTLSGAIVVKHCGQAPRSSTAVKHRKARAESMPLYLVLFFLDTTSMPKQNFAQLFCRNFQGTLYWSPDYGGIRALFARLDGTVHQSRLRRSRTLAAGRRRVHRSLQQLRRTRPQRFATTWSQAANAASVARRVQAADATTLEILIGRDCATSF